MTAISRIAFALLLIVLAANPVRASTFDHGPWDELLSYDAGRLDAQLEDSTRHFVSDRTRNRVSAESLQVSSIFKWYRDDFETGWRNAHILGAFLALYGAELGLDEGQIRRLVAGDTRIAFLDYGWRLNRVP